MRGIFIPFLTPGKFESKKYICSTSEWTIFHLPLIRASNPFHRMDTMALVPLMNSLSLTHHSYTRILHEVPLVIAIEEKDEREQPIPHGTLDLSVNYSTQDQRSAMGGYTS